MERVFPFRFYGDGTDTTGLNAFELLTMLSVAPNHTSSMKTRFVFPGHSFIDSTWDGILISSDFSTFEHACSIFASPSVSIFLASGFPFATHNILPTRIVRQY